jgi:type VI protein secretion system component VasK
MPSQEVINLIITGAGTIFGWLLKSMWEAVRDLKNDMREIESEVHREYVRKDEFRADLDEIKSILKEIFADLKKKADK